MKLWAFEKLEGAKQERTKMEIRRPLLIIIFLYSNVELPVKTKHTQSFNGTLKLET